MPEAEMSALDARHLEFNDGLLDSNHSSRPRRSSPRRTPRACGCATASGAHRRSLRRDQGNGGGVLLRRGARPERGDPGRRAHPERAAGHGRGAPLPRPRGRRRAAQGLAQAALGAHGRHPCSTGRRSRSPTTKSSPPSASRCASNREVMGPGHQELMAAIAAQGIATAGRVRASPEDGCRGLRLGDLRARRFPHVPRGRVDSGKLRAAKVARTVYHGPYEGLGEAVDKYKAWIAANGYATRPQLPLYRETLSSRGRSRARSRRLEHQGAEASRAEESVENSSPRSRRRRCDSWCWSSATEEPEAGEMPRHGAARRDGEVQRRAGEGRRDAGGRGAASELARACASASAGNGGST